MEIDTVKQIIAEQFNVSLKELNDETSLVDDLSADSLDIFQLITALEEEFDIEISNDDAEKIKTVGDISKFIKENFD